MYTLLKKMAIFKIEKCLNDATVVLSQPQDIFLKCPVRPKSLVRIGLERTEEWTLVLKRLSEAV